MRALWPRAARALHVLCFSMLPFAGAASAGGAASEGESVAKEDPALANVRGVVLYRGAPFSGEVVERRGERVLSRTPYLDGKEHGVAEAFYPDGGLRHQKIYEHGRREGTHRGFWENGQAQFVRRYEKDLFEGEQVAHYKNGVLAELRHYRKGHEEGQQRLYDGDGRLIGNYTFKNGKRYGIVGRFDCMSVVHP